TATELLTALEATDSELHWRKGWPKDGHALSQVLRRLGPALRLAGVAVTLGLREGHEGTRVIKIEQVREICVSSVSSLGRSHAARDIPRPARRNATRPSWVRQRGRRRC